MKNANSKLFKTSIILHWVIALLIISIAVFRLGQSFGILVLIIAIPRIIWRIRHGWPKSNNEHQKVELALSKSIHWILLLGTVFVPLTGIMLAATSGEGVLFFGLELFPATGKSADLVAHYVDISHQLHYTGLAVLTVAVGVHVVGALKHHIVDKDITLKRMLGINTQETAKAETSLSRGIESSC